MLAHFGNFQFSSKTSNCSQRGIDSFESFMYVYRVPTHDVLPLPAYLLRMKLKAQLASYSECCMLHVHSISPGRAIKPHSSCSKNIMPWQAGLQPEPWLHYRARYVWWWLAGHKSALPVVSHLLLLLAFYKKSQRLQGLAHHPSISGVLHDTS
jgi:hypothetical protein